MLVLSRKERERILIGDNIEITIVRIRGNHVRVGIAAPRDLPIQREELAQRIGEMAGLPAEVGSATAQRAVATAT